MDLATLLHVVLAICLSLVKGIQQSLEIRANDRWISYLIVTYDFQERCQTVFRSMVCLSLFSFSPRPWILEIMPSQKNSSNNFCYRGVWEKCSSSLTCSLGISITNWSFTRCLNYLRIGTCSRVSLSNFQGHVLSTQYFFFFGLFTFIDYLCPARTCGPSPAHILHPWPARPILPLLPFSSLRSFGSSLSNKSLISLRTWRAWK